MGLAKKHEVYFFISSITNNLVANKMFVVYIFIFSNHGDVALFETIEGGLESALNIVDKVKSYIANTFEDVSKHDILFCIGDDDIGPLFKFLENLGLTSFRGKISENALYVLSKFYSRDVYS